MLGYMSACLTTRNNMRAGGPVVGLELPKRVFPCASPADVRSTLPEGKDVLAFQARPLYPVPFSHHVPWSTMQHRTQTHENVASLLDTRITCSSWSLV